MCAPILLKLGLPPAGLGPNGLGLVNETWTRDSLYVFLSKFLNRNYRIKIFQKFFLPAGPRCQRRVEDLRRILDQEFP